MGEGGIELLMQSSTAPHGRTLSPQAEGSACGSDSRIWPDAAIHNDIRIVLINLSSLPAPEGRVSGGILEKCSPSTVNLRPTPQIHVFKPWKGKAPYGQERSYFGGEARRVLIQGMCFKSLRCTRSLQIAAH